MLLSPQGQALSKRLTDASSSPVVSQPHARPGCPARRCWLGAGNSLTWFLPRGCYSGGHSRGAAGGSPGGRRRGGASCFCHRWARPAVRTAVQGWWESRVHREGGGRGCFQCPVVGSRSSSGTKRLAGSVPSSSCRRSPCRATAFSAARSLQTL